MTDSELVEMIVTNKLKEARSNVTRHAVKDTLLNILFGKDNEKAHDAEVNRLTQQWIQYIDVVDPITWIIKCLCNQIAKSEKHLDLIRKAAKCANMT